MSALKQIFSEGKSKIQAFFQKTRTNEPNDPKVPHSKWALPILLSSGVLLFLVFVFNGNKISAADPSFERYLYSLPADSVEVLYSPLPRRPFQLRDLPMHPQRQYADYVPNGLDKNSTVEATSPLNRLGSLTYQKFLTLLDVFATRQGRDDNFTVRMYDKEDNTIDVHRMRAESAQFEALGFTDWKLNDEKRRSFGDSLKGMYKAKGYATTDVQARWGRKNQVMEARQREESLICYELRLAKRLGLSSLVTEIGTVETFNEDHLVSSVGARGRYQFMPSMLRTFGINSYKVKTVSGGQLMVREEQNPLLTMEPSFTLAKAYSNAVGHEIPGVSAYHTGPGNIFKVYQMYLQNKGVRMPDNSVVAAFVWGLTTGYPLLSTRTSFKTYSQGYFPSLYGSMRAVEELTIDPRKMLKAELSQVSDGVSITLSEILKLLQENNGERLDWGAGNNNGSLYTRFRELNPQIPLPAFDAEFVPQSGDLVLTKWSSDGKRIRFFLPQGATEILERADSAILDENATQRWDHTTFLDPTKTGEKVEVDYQYDDLVASISRFGFTLANKDRLRSLAAQMTELANSNPSAYRKTQLRIIKMHQDVWNTAAWQTLANLVSGSTIQFQPAPRNFDTFNF